MAAGKLEAQWRRLRHERSGGDCAMNSDVYLIGLVVVVLAILSFLGFH